jgi:ribosome-binding ATPase YchF (GTP1/OBG family)
VLIHVVDTSGNSDAEGNIVDFQEEDTDKTEKTMESSPLYDLSWIHNELIQWIANNIESKWDTIVRRGKNKV